jgi:hypothetical protein
MGEWGGIYLLMMISGMGVSLALYWTARKLWPDWPHLVQSLWLFIAVIGVLGFPVALYIQTVSQQGSDPQFYNAYGFFIASWLVLAGCSILITLVLRLTSRRAG